jgi:hypothetical protein
MADQNLSVGISVTADTATLTDFDNRIKALEASMKSASSATSGATSTVTAHGEAHHEAAEHVKESGEAVEKLTGNLGQVSSATSLMSELLEKMGIEAGGASEAINLASESIETFASKAPLILGIGAAAAAAAAEFLILKDSVEVAAAAQYQLVSIGALIRNQGGDFKENTQAISEYSMY